MIIVLSAITGILVYNNCNSSSHPKKVINPVTFHSEDDYIIYCIKQEMGNGNVKVKTFNKSNLKDINVFNAGISIASVSLHLSKDGSRVVSIMAGSDVYSKKTHLKRFSDLLYTLILAVTKHAEDENAKKVLYAWLKNLIFDCTPNTPKELECMGLKFKYNRWSQTISLESNNRQSSTEK